MSILHIAPGHSAGGSLRQAIRAAGRQDEVLFFRDDLSCGPIDSDDLAPRLEWSARFHNDWETEAAPLRAFWERVTTSDDRLIVWFGRHSALELAFFLVWADRLGERPYDIVDVPPGPSRPAVVSILPELALVRLLGTERQVTAHETAEARRQWRKLRAENAPFRVVAPQGLVSAPADHFDHLLIEQVTPEWKKIARVIGDVYGIGWPDSYLHVGDLMLLGRVMALIDEGKLAAEVVPWDMHACRVRLPSK
jgi:hypothetical protein